MTTTTPPRVRACIFDMDGLLINSEDIYTIAVNRILADHGRPPIPWSIKAQMQGRPAPEATRVFDAWAQLPLPPATYHSLLHTHHTALFPTCRALPGVEPLLATLAASPVHLALATSSHSTNFALKTAHLRNLFDHFPASCVVKGDDPRVPAGRGKPAPDIFRVALRAINEAREAAEPGVAPIRAAECLVFEDSVPGVEAARRAGMQVVWVPHEGLFGECGHREREILAGLTGEHVGEEEGEEEEREEGEGSGGWPGTVGDAWGRRLESLEQFPYDEYGIVVTDRML